MSDDDVELYGTETTLLDRLREEPRPALRWAAVLAVLVALEAGALFEVTTWLFEGVVGTLRLDPLAAVLADLQAAVGRVPVLADVQRLLADPPTLLSRETIPNRGYDAGSGWQGPFLGLEPRTAWLMRVVLVYAYAFLVLYWLWRGYLVYRAHYRVADWTPRDDVVDRFRGHRWGQFGLVVVVGFVVMATFAPALGPTTVRENIDSPYKNKIQYFDDETGNVTEIYVGAANRESKSKGQGDDHVGIWSYDDFGRFHPFGTLPSGKDLFTFAVHGARVSLVIGLLAILLTVVAATALSLVSAYYKGSVDLALILASDTLMVMPRLLLMVLLVVILGGTWIADIYNGGLVLALIFALSGWTIMWRTLRGPALQVAESDWIDAAKSFGQTPTTIMRKHMLPYITGYLLIYGSMTLGGAIIAVSALSFLGLGVNPPTPEWGRAIDVGQDYVDTQSWHISFIPGLLITLVVTGFNALGDGIRDAIDPQSDTSEGETVGRGGGA